MTNIFGEITITTLLIFSDENKLLSLEMYEKMASKVYDSKLIQIKKVKRYTNPKQPKFQHIFA